MSESNESPASAEERQRRIDEQTSVGAYTLKQVRQIGITLVGATAGFFTAKALLKTPAITGWAEKTFAFSKTLGIKSKSFFTMAGTLVGVNISGIVIAYEHWRNLESEKLAVGEINEDVAHLVSQRSAFAETLHRQEEVIKELAAKSQERAQFTQSVKRQEALINDLVAKGQEKGASFSDRTAAPAIASDMARS